MPLNSANPFLGVDYQLLIQIYSSPPSAEREMAHFSSFSRSGLEPVSLGREIGFLPLDQPASAERKNSFKRFVSILN